MYVCILRVCVDFTFVFSFWFVEKYGLFVCGYYTFFVCFSQSLKDPGVYSANCQTNSCDSFNE